MALFSDARPYLNTASVTSHAREALSVNCLGRAVLLMEMIEQVGARQLGALLGTDATTLSGIAAMIRREIAGTAQVTDTRRYLPPHALDAHRTVEGSFQDRVARSRPVGWSWTELAAAGAPISAAVLTGIAREAFEESRQLDALNEPLPWRAPAARRFTLVERCAISGCPFFAPRREADEDRKSEAPRFADPPAKRLRRASESGRKDQDPRQVGWRFQGHLQSELQIRMSIRSFSRSWKSY